MILSIFFPNRKNNLYCVYFSFSKFAIHLVTVRVLSLGTIFLQLNPNLFVCLPRKLRTEIRKFSFFYSLKCNCYFLFFHMRYCLNRRNTFFLLLIVSLIFSSNFLGHEQSFKKLLRLYPALNGRWSLASLFSRVLFFFQKILIPFVCDWYLLLVEPNYFRFSSNLR